MKEVYYQIKNDRPEDSLSIAQLQYTYQDFDRVIQIGGSIFIDWSEDEKNIEKMEDIASRPGFMFFNNSTEGMEFWKDKRMTIKPKQRWVKKN
jgi:hypothetical protein